MGGRSGRPNTAGRHSPSLALQIRASCCRHERGRAGAEAPTPLKEGFQEGVPATFISRPMRSPAVTEEVRMAATTSNTSAQKTAAAATVNPIAA